MIDKHLHSIDQYLSGNFVEIDSSYCKAISFQLDYKSEGRGEIGIKYHDNQEWVYYPYHIEEAISFYDAVSKGKWAWEHIRVKGQKHKHHREARRIR